MRFLNSLRIPVIGILRDSQNFVVGADQGIGIHEMPAGQVKQELGQMNRIVRWVEQTRVQIEPAEDLVPIQSEQPLPGRSLH